MGKSVANDSTPPTVVASTPAAGATEVPIGVQPTARFSEPVDPSTLGAFEIRDSSGTLVPSTVSYDELTATATLVPSVALTYGTTYTATIRSGASGLKDRSGNALATDKVWTFAAESVPPPILVIGSTSNKFTLYTTEILRAEGLNDYATLDISLVSPFVLSYYNVAILGDTPLTPTQVTTLTNWVNGGGNLIALHPDKQLAGLLGLTDNAATLTNAYLKVDTTSAAGAGIVGQSIQFHGTADRYTLNGATALAWLYSNAGTATTSPAVTTRSVGSNGGDAAAFAFDLNKSIVYTRQGNPAWAGQDRDGVGDIRTNDLFYGAKSGDVQPDWTDTSKIGIPQADEQQRLLVNMITLMNRDKMPLPRFWYLPRDKKAVVIMTGDDHATGGTAGRFDTYLADSPPGCSVANWECVRSTSYIYPDSPLTNAQAASYTAQGFEVALHASIDRSCKPWPDGGLDSGYFTPQLAAVRGQVHERAGSGDEPDALRRVDRLGDASPRSSSRTASGSTTNYYHYPASWIGNKPGLPRGHRRDHALRRPRRQPDRRLPGADAQHGRVEHGAAGVDQLPARQGARRGGVLRHVHRAHPHRHRREPGLRRRDRLGPVARRAGHLREAGADVDGRPQQLDLPELLLERRHARLHHQRRGRLERAAGDAPDDVERRPPERDHPRRHGGALHHADDQGHRVRLLRRRHRHVLGDVLVTAQALVTARRPAGRRRRARLGE